jgi:hypothetical protein
LADILWHALKSGTSAGLVKFIAEHHALLRDPIEGEPLGADWESEIEAPNVQVYADVALTLFYDPSGDIGLSDAWIGLDDLLHSVDGAQTRRVIWPTGTALRPWPDGLLLPGTGPGSP